MTRRTIIFQTNRPPANVKVYCNLREKKLIHFMMIDHGSTIPFFDHLTCVYDKKFVIVKHAFSVFFCCTGHLSHLAQVEKVRKISKSYPEDFLHFLLRYSGSKVDNILRFSPVRPVGCISFTYIFANNILAD